MSSNLDPEELEALVGSPAGAPAVVSQWDRGRLRRFSSDDADEAHRSIARALPLIESTLSDLAGFDVEVALGTCHEVDAEGLLDEVEDPPALVCFRVGGQPGWCLWDNPTAVATIESVLGAAAEGAETDDEEVDDVEKKESDKKASNEKPAAPAPPPPFDPEAHRRFLTPMERKVLVRLLRVAIDRIAKSLRVETSDYDAVERLKHAPTWRESQGLRPDPHRLAVDLVLTTPAGETTLSIYMPVSARRGAYADGQAHSLDDATGVVPQHLDLVPIAVDVELGHAELTLGELLGLEVGDVVPIDAVVGDRTVMRAAGVPFAHGRMGTHRGHVAIHLESVEDRQSDRS